MDTFQTTQKIRNAYIHLYVDMYNVIALSILDNSLTQLSQCRVVILIESILAKKKKGWICTISRKQPVHSHNLNKARQYDLGYLEARCLTFRAVLKLLSTVWGIVIGDLLRASILKFQSNFSSNVRRYSRCKWIVCVSLMLKCRLIED